MKKYWFTPKSYGYGFAPITWEGWVAVIIFIGLLFISTYINDFFTPELETKDGLRFVFDVFIASGVFTALFRDKVDGDLQWRWGRKTKET